MAKYREGKKSAYKRSKQSNRRRKGVAIFSTSDLQDALKMSKQVGKGFYVRPRWFGGWSVFGRKK